jgi:tetratricopeptide (TPR) repeat protein
MTKNTPNQTDLASNLSAVSSEPAVDGSLKSKIARLQKNFKEKVVDNPKMKWYRRTLYGCTMTWALFLAFQSLPYYNAIGAGEEAFKLGRYEKARKEFETALLVCQTFGPDWQIDKRTARAMNNIAELYRIQGRYLEARPYYEKAAEAARLSFSASRPEPAVALSNLATLEREQGNYQAAEKSYLRALELWQTQIKQPDSPQLASLLNGLAKLRRDQGRYSEAETLYLKALAISEKKLGRSDVGNAYLLANLGGLYRDLGQSKKAEKYYQRAFYLDLNALGDQHPDTAIDLNNLAGLYREENRLGEARTLYERALEIRLKAFGPDHPLTAKTLMGIGDLERRLQNYDKAQVYFDRALAIQKRALPAIHPDLAITLDCQGISYLQMGGSATVKARDCFSRALEMRQKLLSADHPDIYISTVNLAVANAALNQGSAADVESALEKLAKRLGAGHPITKAERALAAGHKANGKDLRELSASKPQ